MVNQEKDIEMFGETVEAMTRMKPKFTDNLMYAMAILSDAQAVMADNPERCRQFINKAKYFIGQARDEQRSKE